MSKHWAMVSVEHCVVCPDCAFTFDAEHTTGTRFSCPNCTEAELLEALKEADGEMTALFNAMSDEQQQTYGPMYAPLAGRVRDAIARAEG